MKKAELLRMAVDKGYIIEGKGETIKKRIDHICTMLGVVASDNLGGGMTVDTVLFHALEHCYNMGTIAGEAIAHIKRYESVKEDI